MHITKFFVFVGTLFSMMLIATGATMTRTTMASSACRSIKTHPMESLKVSQPTVADSIIKSGQERGKNLTPEYIPPAKALFI